LTADHAMRSVVIVAYDGCQSLDVSGPWEVFTKANLARMESGMPPQYQLLLASPAGGRVRCNSGLAWSDSKALHEIKGPLDTVIVAGGNDGCLGGQDEQPLLTWLQGLPNQARRICSVCTGVFPLASAGLLVQRRVTTHWQYSAELARLYPCLTVEADAIFVADPPYFSSAGVTAGIDLSLALVEADLGFEVALHVARQLVLYLRRQGGQSQFSAPLRAQAADGSGGRFASLRAWIQVNLRQDLSLAVLAERANVSPRQFGRAFCAETGVTPGRFVEQLRLDRAKALLEATDNPLKRIAEAAGFSSVDSLQRCLRRQAGISPAEYRRRFSRLKNA
jgi:transcriptional regulator GlxA family with amidase domain